MNVLAVSFSILALPLAPQNRAPQDAQGRHELALTAAGDGRPYLVALSRAAREIERDEGLEPALAWLRELADWDPAELAHLRVLGDTLARHERHGEAAQVFERGAEQGRLALQLEFDEAGAVLWDPLRAADPSFRAGAMELSGLLKAGARERSALQENEVATSLNERAMSLVKTLQGNDEAQAGPTVSGGRRHRTRALEAAVRRGHPTDRRFAAAMLLDRLGRGRVNPRRARAVARVVQDEQLDLGRPWVPDLGDTLETLWGRGVLDLGDVDAYLALAVPPPSLTLRTSASDATSHVVTCELRPRVADAQHSSSISLSARLTFSDARIDGEPAALLAGAVIELERLVAGEVEVGPLTLVTPAPLAPGRHVLTLTCGFTIRATGAEGEPKGEGGGQHALRLPFRAR